MRKAIRALIGIVLVLLLAIVAYHRFPVQTKGVFFSVFPIFSWVSVEQPILFNHRRHKEAANLNCTFCHRHAERKRSATIPNIDLCRACHSTDAISKTSSALKVVRHVQEGREIPWKRMYELPKFVVFPHWVHVQSGVDCSVCHGLTGKKERPVKMVDRNYMAWCMDCHQRRGADNDCYACHSS
jgi:hypothetical protein